MFLFILLNLFCVLTSILCAEVNICGHLNANSLRRISFSELHELAKFSVPNMEGTLKEGSGRIGVIGGSAEFSGTPYFSAIAALKTGADLVYVITTERAAPVIKSYSPDLIVHPYLDFKNLSKINTLLTKLDLVIIGPGLGQQNDTVLLVVEIIKRCKELKLPLVIDADGLYVISKNPNVIKGYLRPGVILTPNFVEMERLMLAVNAHSPGDVIEYFGEYVSILTKGSSDKFISFHDTYSWNFSYMGSGRRAAGQGDILSGIMGTFFHWTLKKRLCGSNMSDNLAASVAANAAAKVTRSCNSIAFDLFGRSMVASDMIPQIHVSFKDAYD